MNTSLLLHTQTIRSVCGRKSLSRLSPLYVCLLLALPLPAMATAPITDDFRGASATLSWTATNGACLTAGSNNGSIPACNGLAYYSGQTQVGLTGNTDPVGQGALRFTNGYPYYHQNGAIILNQTFPSNQGVQVTFVSYTYGGDNSGGHGADGIGFYILNGTQSPNIGAWGGSLGYSCSNSNTPYVGMTGAYLGLGIDEYGNFLNHGDNTASGPGAQSNRIGLRGYGNVSWSWLNANYPLNYPSSLNTSSSLCSNLNPSDCNSAQEKALKATCMAGKILDYSFTTQSFYPISNISTTKYGAWSESTSGSGSSTTYSCTQTNNITAQWGYIGGGGGTNSDLEEPSGSPTSGTQVQTCKSATASCPSSGSSLGSMTSCSSTYNYSGNTSGWTAFTYGSAGSSVADYAYISGSAYTLPTTEPIADESATTRTAARPITYNLKITSAGLLSFGFYYNGGAYQPVLTNTNIATNNGPMPSSFKFGFGGSTGGSDNVHEITCFRAATVSSSSSAGVNTIQTGQIKTGTQIYLAMYHPDNWWGQLVSENLVTSGTTTSPTVGIATTANWDANCVLTGGGCPAMGTNALGNPLYTITAESPSTRQILTWNGTAGAAFEWGNLTTGQQAALNSEATTIGGTASGQYILNWLRGDQSEEQTSGPLRLRTGVLGDIVDSSPTVVGAPAAPYSTTWVDALYGATTGLAENATAAQHYVPLNASDTSAFETVEASRLNVVYDGANDGILHGFRTGSYSGTTYNSSTNDGLEVIGYVPGSLVNNAATLASPLYGHTYFVDATPGTGDVFYGNLWHTWLAGSLGSGGTGVYALDITHPSTFSEGNASTLVKGEWTATSISCSNVTNCGNFLGMGSGTPIFRRLHNGQWAMIFGNGSGSSNGSAGIFIGLIQATGAVNFLYLDTGAGSASNPNGIAYAASADLDGDNTTDYVYAGDNLGNVWRFDLTSSNPLDWAVSKYGHSTPTPLFTATSASGTLQPITTSVQVAGTYMSGQVYTLIMFGTGAQTPQTNAAAIQYAPGTQSVYGIWDWDMTAWNHGQTTAHNVQIPASMTQQAALSTPQTITRSNLQAQTVTATSAGTTGSTILGYRSVSDNNVCWQGSSICTPSTTDTMMGWYMDLPGTNEQVIYNPVIFQGALVLNTTIPPSAVQNQCTADIPTGWSMAFNIQSGGGFPAGGAFPNSSDAYSSTNPVAGIQTNGTGSPWIVTVSGSPVMITQTSNSTAIATGIGGGGGNNGGGSGGGNCTPLVCDNNGICKAMCNMNTLAGHRATWELIR